MQNFQELALQFETFFNKNHFPKTPANLYDASNYMLQLGGKRARPVLCLMGNELFDEIKQDTFHVAAALEIFHNFTLVHDDIMDNAPLRRGLKTVHEKWNTATAILSGDVMLVKCYEYLNFINKDVLHNVLLIFNKTAKEVCEGQQLDMNFEKQEQVVFDEYVNMIALKTSILLAASLQLGALLGGASASNQHHLFEFGKNLGIAFQIQDDYLDAFGDPEKFGKQIGGDILSNKKTFLLLHTMEVVNENDKLILENLLLTNDTDKVKKMLALYEKCNVKKWAMQLKQNYFDKALQHLDDVAVLSARKESLINAANFFIQREN